MLCNGVSKRIELEHEPGEWVSVRLLGYRALEEAREARSLRVIRKVREMGSELMNGLPAANSNGAVVEIDPLNDYDVPTLLRAGVVDWSYDAPVTAENVDSLDERTARMVALALVPEHDPPETRGNGHKPSTAGSTGSKA